MAENLPEPESRKEAYLAKAAGVSVEELPTPASREELYLNAIANGGGGGGGSVTVVQTIGTSTTDVMSQDATTQMVFEDANSNRIKIGNGASTHSGGAIAIGRSAAASGSNSIAIGPISTMATGQRTIALGYSANTLRQSAIAIGYAARAQGNGSIAIGGYSGDNDAALIQNNKHGSIALGMGSQVTEVGEMNIGDRTSTYGYNSSAYRLLTGLYDPQSAHDAATKGYVDGLVGNIESALNAINNGGGN